MAVRDSLPVLIGARRYNVDLAGLARSTIDPIRQGFDTQGTPGEQSLNQAGVWKRSRNNWDLGAGQREADTDEANNRRFYTSTGVDVWTRNEVTLLKTTAQTLDSDATNQLLDTAISGGQDYVYAVADNDVWYSTNDGNTWTEINEPAGAGAITAMASDGANIYVASAVGSGEVQKITGSTVPTSTANTDYWVIDDVDGLWVASGYLIASVGSRLTVLSPGSAPATADDITASTFSQIDTWNSVIGTPAGIYAAGTKGDVSRIFYIGINSSELGGADLVSPVIASELPHGETVNVLAYYGGLLCIGTSKGIRLGMLTGNGYVTYGPRIDIKDHDGNLVGTSCFEPQGEFIWFGWTDYSATTTGLGRLGLSEFTASLVPAYASDLQTTATVQGTVAAVTTANDGRLLFAVNGGGTGEAGVWQEHATNYVASGNVDSGRVRWGTTEKKAVTTVDVKHAELATGESVVVKVLAEDDVTVATGVTSDTDGETTPGIAALPATSGEYVSSVIILAGPGGTTPTLKRWTFRAIPMPFISEVIQIPIMLSTYTEWDNRHVHHNTYDDYAYLKGLMEARDLVSFKIGEEPAQTVYVAGVSYNEGSLKEWTDDRQWFEGVLTVQLVTVQT